jgi:hypothetical protein
MCLALPMILNMANHFLLKTLHLGWEKKMNEMPVYYLELFQLNLLMTEMFKNKLFLLTKNTEPDALLFSTVLYW